MRLRLAIVSLLLILCVPAVASATTWRAVKLPPHASLSAVSCLEVNWCEAVGGWQNRLEEAHWNGRSWTVSTKLPNRRSSSLSAIACRSRRFCIAVGNVAPGQFKPVEPLIERWDGHRWRVDSAPKPQAPKGYRAMNTRLYGVACPGAKLCFAVGQAVPFGAGAAPGVPLIERWDGRRWHLMSGARGAQSPLMSVSCTSTRACTAVGSFRHVVGNPTANNEQTEYPVTIERWDGSRWSAQSVAPPAGTPGVQLFGVSCTSATACAAAGSAGPSLTATWNGGGWTAQTLTGPPGGRLNAIACQTSASCMAVGQWTSADGRTGPLSAFWNGTGWAQTVIHRGPTWLTSVSCPALGWCMAVGSTIAEIWR